VTAFSKAKMVANVLEQRLGKPSGRLMGLEMDV